jgi:multisubunit Na+/H+ antiporter MnhB subunit
MEVNLAIAGIVIGLAIVIWMIVLEKRPVKDFAPRRIPTVPVMFFGILVMVISLAFLMSVLGIENPRR